MQKSYEKYRQTEKCLFTRIYATQKRNSKNRGHNPPSYTKEEMVDFILSQNNFKDLFREYKESGFVKYYAPSLDRIENDKGYTLDNLNLSTFRANLQENGRHSKEGLIACKRVSMYKKSGEFIKTFLSGTIAEKETKVNKYNIYSCCANKLRSAGGFVWRYDSAKLIQTS